MSFSAFFLYSNRKKITGKYFILKVAFTQIWQLQDFRKTQVKRKILQLWEPYFKINKIAFQSYQNYKIRSQSFWIGPSFEIISLRHNKAIFSLIS